MAAPERLTNAFSDLNNELEKVNRGTRELGDELRKLEDETRKQRRSLVQLTLEISNIGQSLFSGIIRSVEQYAPGIADVFRIAMEDFQAAVGRYLVPVIEQATSALDRLNEWITGLSESTREAIGQISGIVAKFFVLSVVIGPLIKAIVSLISVFGGFWKIVAMIVISGLDLEIIAQIIQKVFSLLKPVFWLLNQVLYLISEIANAFLGFLNSALGLITGKSDQEKIEFNKRTIEHLRRGVKPGIGQGFDTDSARVRAKRMQQGAGPLASDAQKASFREYQRIKRTQGDQAGREYLAKLLEERNRELQGQAKKTTARPRATYASIESFGQQIRTGIFRTADPGQRTAKNTDEILDLIKEWVRQVQASARQQNNNQQNQQIP